MCEYGLTREIVIERRLEVDACIAEQIVQLNRLGVYTTGCCCGHGEMPATATILPSAQTRARELGFAVTNLSIRLDSWPATASAECERLRGEMAQANELLIGTREDLAAARAERQRLRAEAERTREIVTRVSARGHITASLDVADLASLLLPATDQRTGGAMPCE